jgi:hypothetical protein
MIAEQNNNNNKKNDLKQQQKHQNSFQYTPRGRFLFHLAFHRFSIPAT